MSPGEIERPAEHSAKCPKCDTELRAAVLGGHCPVCLVKRLRDSEAGHDIPVFQFAIRDPQSGMQELRYFGDFELLAELGRGGMGVVYRARQLSLNRTVALKLISPGHVASPKALERFRAEAEAAASLDHPNIVPIYETGEVEGRHYFSMKLIDGQSLAQRMGGFALPMAGSTLSADKSATRKRASEIASFLAIIAKAVHYAHQRGVLHRDLKPGNILLDASGEPHVADFGLAKHFEIESSLTLSGEVIGTPAYMPPEQATGRIREMTIASDTYSLGVILYELLTGRPPFRGETAVETLHAVLHTDPVAPRSLNPAVPRDLETICLKCLEKQPSKRYSSALDLAGELHRFNRGEPIQARAVSKPEKIWRWCGRNPALSGALGSIAVALLLGLAGIFWQWRRAEQSAVQAHGSELAARENLYAADISQIQHALEADNLRQARELLQKQIPKPGEPDLRGFEWRYLWRQCQSDELFSLPGHKKTAFSLAFSPDGRLLATASEDRTAKIWDLVNHRLLATLAADTAVNSVSFSPGGDLLATASKTGVRIWDAKTFKLQHSLPQSAAQVAFSPNGTYLAILGTNLVLCDTQSWAALQKLEPERPGTWKNPFESGLAFSPDGSRLGIAVQQGIRLLGVPDLQEQVVLKDRMPRNRFLAFSPDGSTLAICTLGYEVKLWDVKTEKEIGILRGHSDSVFAAAFSPDGTKLITGGSDQTIKLWDVGSATLIRSFQGHLDEVFALGFSPDGKSIASASRDGAIKVWNPDALPRKTSELRGVFPFGFSSDGNLMAFTTNSILTAFDAENLQQVDAQIVRGPKFNNGFFVGFGHLFTDGRTGGMQIVPNHEEPDLAYSLEMVDLQRQGFLCSVESVTEMASFAPISHLLATGTSNQTVTVWQLPQGSRKCVVTNSAAPLAFSPDERLLVTMGPVENSLTLTLTLWRLYDDQGRLTPTVLKSMEDIGFSAFSTAGRTLAGGGEGGFIRLFAVPSGEVLGNFIGHKRDVSGLSFSPDDRTLASIADDGTARLWHVATRRELLKFQTALKDPNWQARLLFSPDGTMLVASQDDNDFQDGPALTRVWYAPSLDDIALTEGTFEKLAPPTDPISWNVRAKALAKHNRLEEAVRALTEVIQQSAAQSDLESLRTSALRQRSQLLRKLGRFTEAGADNCAALNVRPRDSHAPARCIDLSAFFNGSLDGEPMARSIPLRSFLDNLPRGLQTLSASNGIHFDLRGVIQLNHAEEFPGVPRSVEGVPIRQKCRRLHFLNGTGWREADDVQIGAYVLHFSDGHVEEIPIRYGQDLRDWVLKSDAGEASNASVAWTGTNSYMGAVRIFCRTWENPRPEVQIESLDFVSNMTKCAPFLIAITVEP